MSNYRYAEIIIDNTSNSTDRTYTYAIPEKHIDSIKVGMRVIVPFGFGNKQLEGIIINLVDKIDIDKNKIKCIKQIIDEEPFLSEEMIKLANWMKFKYLAKYNEVYRTILPTGITKKIVKIIKLKDDFLLQKYSAKSLDEKEVVKYLIQNKECTLNDLKENHNIKNLSYIITSLEKQRIINITNKIGSKVNKKFEKYVCLNLSNYSASEIIHKISKRATKQQEIIKYLVENKKVSLKVLRDDLDCSLSTIKSLEKKEFIKILDEEINRNPITKNYKKSFNLKLTYEQENCLNTILKNIKTKSNNKFLIHGVTGSGKTEIYLQLIEYMLSLKKQAIVLVPEISLTPQTVERFVSRFGEKVAIFHSRLSLGERYDEWRKAKDGLVDIVVGARSAVFSPLKNLGLIVIDEEHESSYKSSMNPKYNTIEVAQKRCDLEAATLILGSATPSIETYYKCEKDIYTRLELKYRVNKRALPKVEIVDMKEELNAGNKSIFSRKLFYAIKENLSNNKQTILFLNRRGFSSFISCRKCGYVVSCKDCDISMTYHITNNILKCHYCGKGESVPTKCPECGSKYIKYFGIGTQKIEEYIKRYFPKAVIARMDVDTTSKKGSHERILDKVKNGDVDILIGTQMISKGLDFHNVTLVGIIAADINLNLPDFRAGERTFQLITQVSGRAGRGIHEGKVILQTYEPNHYSIQYAKEHDYIKLYHNEIILRKEFNYPPFTNLINIIISSKDMMQSERITNEFWNLLLDYIKNNISDYDINNMFGPNPAPIAKIKNNFRYQILIKSDDDKIDEIKEMINYIYLRLKKIDKKNEIRINIDINPNSIM